MQPTFHQSFKSHRFSEFSDHPLVGEVRGVGLIGAAELVSDKAKKSGFSTPGLVGNKVLSICQKNGLICRAIGDVIAFCPPLIITEQQIDELFEKFKKSMDETFLIGIGKENISWVLIFGRLRKRFNF